MLYLLYFWYRWYSMDILKKLVPIDAYAAAKHQDGTISVQDLSDPTVVVVVVVEFEVEKRSISFLVGPQCIEPSCVEYVGIYHDEFDCWEIFGDNGKHYAVVHSGDEYYDLCQEVVIHFKDKLLAGHRTGKFADRLARKAAEEIRDEIDRDIINDLRGMFNTHSTISTKPVIIRNDRKLKMRWSLDPVDALEVSKPIGVVSRLDYTSTQQTLHVFQQQ